MNSWGNYMARRNPRKGDLWQNTKDKSVWKVNDVAIVKKYDHYMLHRSFTEKEAPVGSKIVYCVNFSDGRRCVVQSKSPLTEFLEDTVLIGTHTEENITRYQTKSEKELCPFCFAEGKNGACLKCGANYHVTKVRRYNCTMEKTNAKR